MSKYMRWLLKELPTAEGVAMLVQQKIITKEEARQMLFKESEQTKITVNGVALDEHTSTAGY